MADASEDLFEAQFQANWDGIRGTLMRLVGDLDEAEDLALETFWRLYTKPPRTQKEAEIKAWLYRVATNLGYNALRSRRRRRRYELSGGEDIYQSLSETDPAAEIQRKADQVTVREVLASLKKRQAQILALRYSGFAYAEIAAVMQVAPGSVGKLLSRAEAAFERQYRSLEGN
jgi:RNA polymerase sigma-70 factor (ECF subfamily)